MGNRLKVMIGIPATCFSLKVEKTSSESSYDSEMDSYVA
jgi:hypothetical protein